MGRQNQKFLPYARQLLDDEDVNAVVKALRGDWLTTGPAVTEFESALAQQVCSQFTVVCSSGTAALHLAMLAMDLGPDDVVIVPSVTFAATANAARYVGAQVVFTDVDPDTGLMRPQDLEQVLARLQKGSAKVVIPVHFTGQTVDCDAINKIAESNNLKIVGDACHALGSRYGGDLGKDHSIGDGCHEDMTVFSFHPAKTVTMGEGGAITTKDAGLARRLAKLRNHGITRLAAEFIEPNLAFDESGELNPWYYEVMETGFNYRVTDIQCALGLSQIKKLGKFVDRRRYLVSLYDTRLKILAPNVMPIARSPSCFPAWHLYVVLIDFEDLGISRGALMRALAAKGIGTQVHYIPLPLQPLFQETEGLRDFPGSAQYYRRCLSLPLHPSMSESDIERVARALEEVLSGL